jgi:hypothetical protein
MARLSAKHPAPSRKRPHRGVSASASQLNHSSKRSFKLEAFVRKHWPEKGRASRTARAQKAWEEAERIAATFKKLDAEMVKRIAEDPELEYS